MKCVHRDIHEYLLVDITIKFGGQKHSIDMDLSSLLTYPLFLETNGLKFSLLLSRIFVDMAC